MIATWVIVSSALCLVLCSSTQSKAVTGCSYRHIVNCTPADTCDLEELVSNFTKVVFTRKEVRLNKKVSYSFLENVWIVGNSTLINCQGKADETFMLFKNIRNLCLEGLIFRHCGGQIHLPNTTDNDRHFYGALFIMISINITLERIRVEESNGGGLYLEGVTGIVKIVNSNFIQNPHDIDYCSNKRRCGGGIFIDQIRSKIAAGTVVIYIKECNFVDNIIEYSTSNIDRRYTNHGGGIYMSIKAPGNQIKVTNCKFENNTAGYGGGMAVTFSNCSYNSTLTIANSSFTNNVAERTLAQHGGGLYLNLESPLNEYNCTRNTSTVTLDNLTFKQNTGWIGGGFAIVGFCQEQELQIIVKNSHWMENQASCGAAVSILRSFKDRGECHSMPTITFNKCTFEDNSNLIVHNNDNNNDDGDVLHLEGWIGDGVFFVIFFNIIFTGEQTTFRSNKNSAIGSINCVLQFNNTNASFINNSGRRGGAISLQGFSYIDLNYSHLVFINNSVGQRGGAVFAKVMIEPTIISAASCFFQSQENESPLKWNSTLTFHNNSAKKSGKSIYVTSLLPCRIAYGINKILDLAQVLNNRTFNFEGSTYKEEVSTGASHIEMNKSDYSAFPGEKFKLQFVLRDDFDENTSGITVKFQFANQRIASLSPSNEIVLKGAEGEKVDIGLATFNVPRISTNISVNLTKCPFGYTINNESQVCKCAVNDNSGPIQCTGDFMILIMKGHYAGIIDGTIVTAVCPDWFCRMNRIEDLKPQRLYKSELEQEMCYSHRTGILCGECEVGYTVYYNSPNFLCKEETRLCELGWLYYILSTLLPLTLIFITVTVFNIDLTVGSLRGFILFGQVIVMINSSNDDQSYRTSRLIWKMIYDTFRLRFFYMDYLSFCLKRNATALDVLSLQYIATAYAAVLVCASLLWIKHCTVHFNKYCSCVRFTTLKHSFVTGLSALLILCYGSIASVSMNILNIATFYNNTQRVGKSRVFLQGNLVYFSSGHLPYALPAFMILLTIVLAPIILFLSCPLINKCFDYFQLSNSNPASRIASQCYLGGRLKPFFDALQGCFKEKARFFAGLYFLYQIMVIISKIYPTTRDQEFFHTSVTLMIILAIHSLFQPYKERLHNIIDTLLFTNLLIINFLSYYVYQGEINPDAHFNATTANVVRIILIYLPLIVFSMAILKLICRKFSWYNRMKRDTRVQNYFRDSLVASNEIIIDSPIPYGATENEGDLDKSYDDAFTASVRNRQFSLSSFVANEQQLLTPN